MALSGNLRDFNLPDVFQLVSFSRKTGVLNIVREDGVAGAIYFKDGEVFFATSNWNRDPLGLRLVKARQVSQKQLEQALKLQVEAGEDAPRLGQLLIDEGFISEKTLEAFVQEQIQDTIFDLMRWDEGQFDFKPVDMPSEEDIGLTVSIENIIMEGSRRLEEWNRIKKKIPSTDLVFKMATAPGEGTFEISLKPSEWRLITMIDGTLDIEQLAAAVAMNDFDVCRILYGMYSAGLLEAVQGDELDKVRLEQAKKKAKVASEQAAAELKKQAEEAAQPEAPVIQLVPKPSEAEAAEAVVEPAAEEEAAPAAGEPAAVAPEAPQEVEATTSEVEAPIVEEPAPPVIEEAITPEVPTAPPVVEEAAIEEAVTPEVPAGAGPPPVPEPVIEEAVTPEVPTGPPPVPEPVEEAAPIEATAPPVMEPAPQELAPAYEPPPTEAPALPIEEPSSAPAAEAPQAVAAEPVAEVVVPEETPPAEAPPVEAPPVEVPPGPQAVAPPAEEAVAPPAEEAPAPAAAGQGAGKVEKALSDLLAEVDETAGLSGGAGFADELSALTGTGATQGMGRREPGPEPEPVAEEPVRGLHRDHNVTKDTVLKIIEGLKGI